MLGNITLPLHLNNHTSKYEDLNYKHTNGHICTPLIFVLYQTGERSEKSGKQQADRGGERCRKREKNREGGRPLPKPTGLRGNLPLLLEPRLFLIPTLSACYCTFLFSLQPLWGRLRVTHHPELCGRTPFCQTRFIPSLHLVASSELRIFKWEGSTSLDLCLLSLRGSFFFYVPVSITNKKV